MNDLQRSVLQKHTHDIVKDLIITEKILGEMYQRNIFDAELIEIIKSGRTHSEQIYKMLEFLPKRGPDAFDNFCDVLQEEYSWVAKLLKDSLETESERILAAQSKKEDSIQDPITPRATSAYSQLDNDIKIRTSAFVQKHFGQIRRISNTDKKAIEMTMSRWLQTERKRLLKSIDDAYTEATETHALESQTVKDRLYSIYCSITGKLQSSPVKKLLNRAKAVQNVQDGAQTPVEDETEIVSVKDVNFEVLTGQIDNLFTYIDYLEKQIDRSYDYLNARMSGKDLSILVHELCGEYRYKERELRQEKEKCEKMLGELYSFSTTTSKLENVIHAQEHEIIAMKESINKIKAENIELIKEVTLLEKDKQVHLEKEKTLVELKKTKEDLHMMIQVVNKENKELKEKMQQQNQTRNTGPRSLQNRRTLANTTNTVQKINTRRPIQKKKSVSFRM